MQLRRNSAINSGAQHHQYPPMIVDFLDSNIIADIDTDLCVVGSGPAGLSIANSFINSGFRVCVLESGGFGGESRTQSLNNGTSVGPLSLDPATSRMRAFGGSCNLWGGGCIALTEQDFEARSWVPESGWPISLEQMAPYYDRAEEFCGVTSRGVSKKLFGTEPSPATKKVMTGDLVDRYCDHSPILFGDAYRARMERSSNITILLHANLLELMPCAAGNSIRQARIGALNGRRGTLKARYFVLACGGIENARLLLLSNSVSARGIGNEHDLVGRYFMDHPIVKLGVICASSKEQVISRATAVAGYSEISLTDASQQQNRVLNCRVRPLAVEGPVPRSIEALRRLRAGRRPEANEDQSVKRSITSALRLQSPEPIADTGSEPDSIGGLLMDVGLGAGDLAQAMSRRLAGLPIVQTDHVDLFGFFEQAPNRDSRITLGEDTDALGQRKVSVNWRLTDLDWRTYRFASKLFGARIADRFGGRFQPDHALDGEGEGDPAAVRSAAHHIGTTRMSADPSTGVVDTDCRVHGVDNLYVVGSSVFPTGGWAFPTLTIIALGLRVADCLAERLPL